MDNTYQRINNFISAYYENKYNTHKVREKLVKILYRYLDKVVNYKGATIICDETNNPPCILDAGRLCVRIQRPLKKCAGEYEYMDFTV